MPKWESACALVCTWWPNLLYSGPQSPKYPKSSGHQVYAVKVEDKIESRLNLSFGQQGERRGLFA